jgi:hypothetical protein
MEQKLDITKASIEQLKAAGFDLVVQMQNIQNALNAVQVELQKREVKDARSIEGSICEDVSTLSRR